MLADGAGKLNTRARPFRIAAAFAVLFAFSACSPSLPSPKVVLPEGTFSEPVTMPATFDPVEMAERLLPFLAHNLDCSEKRKGCLPRFETILDRGIESRHANWDFGDLSGRYVEAFFLLRRMTGSREYVEQEESLRRRWLATFGKDGLTYREKTPYSDHEADLFDQSSSLSALATWYAFTGDPKVRAMIDRMIDRLWTLAKHEDGACWFEYPTYLPDGSPGPHRDNWQKADAAHHGGRLLLGLSRYLANDGTDRARELAACTVKNLTVRTREFDPTRKEVFSGQMHSRTSTLVGLLRYASITNDDRLLDLGAKVYAYAKSLGTDFGWFPEWADPSHPENPHTKLAEGEITGDMIQAALLLAPSDPAYYDDVERFARNHFYESQLRSLPQSIARDSDPAEAVGAFAGYAAPSDWGKRTMNCCAGGAAEALYELWLEMSLDVNHRKRIMIDFGTTRRVETVPIAGTTYTVTWVGNDVTKIDPPGTFLPLYQGRDREPPKVTRRYFIPKD
jgi:hypothetical protein